MIPGKSEKARPDARVGSVREGETSGRGEIWTLLRAVGLLALGVVVMSWIIT